MSREVSRAYERDITAVSIPTWSSKINSASQVYAGKS